MLHTARLSLVPLGAEHFEPLAAMYGDAEVIRFLEPAPLDRGEAWRRLAMHVGHWALGGYGNFACIEKTSGAFVGRCGPWFPEGWPALEIGYSFQREFWGTRIRVGGGESVRALRVRRVAGARRHQPGASGQPPPQRVAERGRATVEREMVVRGLPVRVFLWPQH